MPVTCNDASGLNQSAYLGASMLNTALSCNRNQQKNRRGLAAKNYPVAGARYPIPRNSLRQALILTDDNLSTLANLRVNPVVFDTFSEGSQCVFRDQITSTTADNSLKKLISVVEMSTDIDDRVTRYGKTLVNSYPMKVAIKRMSDFLRRLFLTAQYSGWLVPSTLASWNGNSFQYTVTADAARPYDVMNVRYSLHYDGAVRQIEVTQTLSK